MKRNLILFILILIQKISFGNYFHSGEIIYKHIQNQEYLIQVNMLSDCNFTGNIASSVYVNVYSKSASGNINLSLSRTSLTDWVINTCNGQLSCSSPNAFKLAVYETTIDLSQNTFSFLNNACDVYFSLSSGIRLSTTNNLGGGPYYLTSFIDKCKAAGNSNAAYHNKFSLFAATNLPYTHNLVNFDKDGDSLSYELIPILRGEYDTLIPNSPYTYKIPLTPYCPPNPGTVNCKTLPNAKPPRGFYFDEKNGMIIFTPTNNEKAYIEYQVNEYRKNQNGQSELIGYSRKSFMLTIGLFGANNYPTITTTTNLNFCSNSDQEVEIKALDILAPTRTSGDSLILDFIRKPEGSYFVNLNNKKDSVIGKLIIPKSAFKQENYSDFIMVSVLEHRCSISFVTEHKVNYNVRLNTGKIAEPNYGDYLCNRKTISLQDSNSIKWNIEKNNKLHYNSYVAFADTSISLPRGQYISKVEYSAANSGCNTYRVSAFEIDSTKINISEIIAKDIKLCQHKEYTFDINKLGLQRPWKSVWTGTFLSNTDSSVTVKPTQSNSRSAFVSITDKAGCKINQNLNWVPLYYIKPNLIWDNNVFCKDDLKTINLSQYNYVTKYYCKFDNFNDSLYYANSHKSNLKLNKSGQFYINYTMEGCEYTDSSFVKVNERIEHLKLKDTSICKGLPAQIRINSSNYNFRNFQWNGLGYQSIQSAINLFDPQISDKLTVTYKDSNFCDYNDSCWIEVAVNKDSFLGNFNFCKTNQVNLFNNIFELKPKGYFTINSIQNGFLNTSSDFNETIVYHENNAVCKFTQRAKIIRTGDSVNAYFRVDKTSVSEQDVIKFEFNGPKPNTIGNQFELFYGDGDVYQFNTSDMNPVNHKYKKGEYLPYMVARNQYNCQDTYNLIGKISVVNTQTNKINTNQSLLIFPNPSGNIFNIFSKNEEFVILYDIQGNLIKIVNLSAGNNVIDVSELASGIYYLKTKQESYQFIKN